MRRRAALQAAAAVLAWPANLAAQPARRFRIACLWVGGEAGVRSLEEAFLAGLREYGYVAGQNLVLDVRYARGDTARLPALADELLALKPDILVGIEAVALVARSKSKTLPIVLTTANDPVAAGLVHSLARPGTNVTGLSSRVDELVAKQIEILREIVPGMSRVALFSQAITGPEDPSATVVARFEAIASTVTEAMGLTLIRAAARDVEGVRQAFAKFATAKPGGVIVVPTGTTFHLAGDIAAQSMRLRLPSISTLPAAWAEAGGLVSYGPNFIAMYRYAALFVDRILKGAQPADIPIEQPALFDFVVNMRTARAIGVTMPRSILLRADRLIE